MRQGEGVAVPAGLGMLGTCEFVEPRLRCLLAEHLGVGSDGLLSHVSLREDLAADSLDLVELAMALEAQFAIVVPEQILDQVRTYGDLVQAICLLIQTRSRAEARGVERPSRVWVRMLGFARGSSGGSLERTGWLTPYAAETIAEDAVHAGPGARLEVQVAGSTTAGLARVQHRFAALGDRGIDVCVRHADRPAGPSPEPDVEGAGEQPRVATAGALRARRDAR